MNFCILYVYLHVSMRGGERKSEKGGERERQRERKREKHVVPMWSPKYSCGSPAFFSTMWSCVSQAQVLKLNPKYIYPLKHLSHPKLYFK